MEDTIETGLAPSGEISEEKLIASQESDALITPPLEAKEKKNQLSVKVDFVDRCESMDSKNGSPQDPSEHFERQADTES